MGILATGIVTQEIERALQGSPVVAFGEGGVGKRRLDREIADAEAFAFEDAANVAADAQVAPIERGRPMVGLASGRVVASPSSPISLVRRRFERRDVEPDACLEVEAVEGCRADDETVAMEDVAELSM